MNLRLAILGLACLALCGCLKTIHVPESALRPRHAQKQVWGPTDVHWIDDQGFGCGNIEYEGDLKPWPYKARIIDWSGKNDDQEMAFHNYSSAERFVERWCKP
jgi:hypothetical protein